MQYLTGKTARYPSATRSDAAKSLRTGLMCWVVLALSLAPTVSNGVEKTHQAAKFRARNLPDIEATPSEKAAFDQEFNLDGSAGISNTSFDYGVGSGWNLGFSLLNAEFYSGVETTAYFQPDLLLNLEKHWVVGDGQLIVGNQIGAGVLPQASIFMHYAYLDVQQHLNAWDADVAIGTYYANAALAGQHSIGAHLNLEIPLAGNIRLSSDYLSGRNTVGAATFKLIYPLQQHWQIAVGLQIPNLQGNDEYIALCGVYWRQ